MSEKKSLSLRRYTHEDEQLWNDFVARSKNGTFLFDRRYMDYHSDRFSDYSLIAFRNEKPYALLPANRKGDTLYSHQGLTYGGLIMDNETTTVHVIEIFEMMNAMLREDGIRRVVYKAIPWIYHLIPAEEPLYAIHRTCQYRLLERDVSSTIVLDHKIKWKESRSYGLRKANNNGLIVEQSEDYRAFWDILTENLSHRHGVSPVHSLDEIMLLHRRFPNNIQLFTAKKDGVIMGGSVVYVTPQVLHTQYISATEDGRRNGAVDAIIAHLLDNPYEGIRYLDFGKSTETHSDQLNENLLFQKEGFGARTNCYDTYEWTLT